MRATPPLANQLRMLHTNTLGMPMKKNGYRVRPIAPSMMNTVKAHLDFLMTLQGRTRRSAETHTNA